MHPRLQQSHGEASTIVVNSSVPCLVIPETSSEWHCSLELRQIDTGGEGGGGGAGPAGLAIRKTVLRWPQCHEQLFACTARKRSFRIISCRSERHCCEVVSAPSGPSFAFASLWSRFILPGVTPCSLTEGAKRTAMMSTETHATYLQSPPLDAAVSVQRAGHLPHHRSGAVGIPQKVDHTDHRLFKTIGMVDAPQSHGKAIKTIRAPVPRQNRISIVRALEYDGG